MEATNNINRILWYQINQNILTRSQQMKTAGKYFGNNLEKF